MTTKQNEQLMVDIEKVENTWTVLFGRPVIKVTKKCIYIEPTSPTGKKRYTKQEIINRIFRKSNSQIN